VLADTLPETAPGGSAAPGSSGRARRLQGSDGRRFARAVFGERVGLAQLAGIAAAVAGFMMFSKDAMTAAPNREAAWVGDLMFVATAVMWATFGALSKHWRAETSRGGDGRRPSSRHVCKVVLGSRGAPVNATNRFAARISQLGIEVIVPEVRQTLTPPTRTQGGNQADSTWFLSPEGKSRVAIYDLMEDRLIEVLSLPAARRVASEEAIHAQRVL
jgi:hypothetical protein